jgi:hypothetical protein
MKELDSLRRRILSCRAILVLQAAIEGAFSVVVWNPPPAHRHLVDALWYASLFAQAVLALILARRISKAKEELHRLRQTDHMQFP